jgi:hypothetical protein
VRTLALACFLAVATLGPVAALDLAPADRSAIRGVVQAQLDAFRRDDGVAAFGYASPSIRRMFRTPERFMTMVREGYAPVYRPRRVDFGEIVDDRGRLTQRVHLVGPDGQPVVANYLMERQADGTWRIDGCILEEVPEMSV